MKKNFLNLAFALLISAITFSSCSKKAKEETKEATEAVSDDAKDAAGSAAGTVESKVSKLSASAKTEYDAITKEIERLDTKIANASEAEKVKLEKTKETFVKKRDALLAD